MLDDGALAKLLRPFGEVLPHQELREREHGQHHVLGNLPTLDVLDGVRHAAPDGGDVDAGIVPWQFAVAHSEIQLEVLPQHLQQRRVEARLVLVGRHREARSRTLAVQRDRQQDQRRLDALAWLVVAVPHQEAQRQEHGVGSTFLHRVASTAIQVDQPCFHVRRGQPDEDLALAQRFPGMFLANVFLVARFMQRLAARVGTVHEVGMSQQLEGMSLGQQVFQRARIRRLQAQRLLARLEVQQ